jgi:hypothetical protein
MEGNMKLSFAVSFGLLVTIDVGSAFAQSPQPLDILGVQLGMPRESAVQLLQNRQPPYNVTGTQTFAVEDLGTLVWHTSLKSSLPDYDIIDLDFAPPPTGSTVLRISRSVSYVDFSNSIPKTKPNAPSVETFVRSVAEKFGSPTPTVVEKSSAGPGAFNITDYVWTRSGEFLPSAELNRRLRYPASCTITAQHTPREIANNNVGYDFHLHFDDKNFEDVCGRVVRVVWEQEGGIIKQFEMTLSDTAGLVLAFAKTAATIDAKKASQHQQELERAKQNNPKF